MHFKEEICSFVILLIFLCYNFSLGYYTLYGVFKSYNEYFCISRRPGNIDYSNNVAVNFFAIEDDWLKGRLGLIKNYDYVLLPKSSSVSEIYKIRSIDLDIMNMTLNLNKSQKVDTNFPKFLKYKIGDSFFRLDCVGSNYESGLNLLDTAGLNSEGFLVSPHQTILKLDGKNISKILNCRQIKMPETCEIKYEHTNLFYKIFIKFFIPLIIFSSLIIRSSHHFNFMGRFIKSISKKFVSPDICPKFCNPLTKNFSHVLKGVLITKMSKINVNYKTKGSLDFYKDDEVEIYLDGSCGVIIRCMNTKKSKVVYLDTVRITELRHYFYNCIIDPENICVSDSEDHFLKTEKVIELMIGGSHLCFSVKKETGYISNINEVEFKLIKSVYSISDNATKFLLKHNWLFFKNAYNMNALKNTLGGKTWYYNRPNNVNNSTWKWYTSDVNHYIKNNTKLKLRVQNIWRKSDAYLKVEKMCENNELNIDFLPKIINIQKKVDTSHEEHNHFTGYNKLNLDLEGFRLGKKPSFEIDEYGGVHRSFYGDMVKLEDSEPKVSSSNYFGVQKGNGGGRSKLRKKVEKEISDIKIVLGDYSNTAKTYKEALMNGPLIRTSENDKKLKKLKVKLKKCSQDSDRLEMMEKIDEIDHEPKLYKQYDCFKKNFHYNQFSNGIKTRAIRLLHCDDLIKIDDEKVLSEGPSYKEVLLLTSKEVTSMELCNSIVEGFIKVRKSKSNPERKMKNKAKKQGAPRTNKGDIKDTLGRRCGSLNDNLLCAASWYTNNDKSAVLMKENGDIIKPHNYGRGNIRLKTVHWIRKNIIPKFTGEEEDPLNEPNDESTKIFKMYKGMSDTELLREVSDRFNINLYDYLEILEKLKKVSAGNCLETNDELERRKRKMATMESVNKGLKD